VIAHAFGLSLSFETPPPGAWEPRPATEPGLVLRSASRAEIEDGWSGSPQPGWEATIDGAPFVAERGTAGDYRFSHGEGALCLLAADGGLLRCALDQGEGAAGWRVVLDSVLFSVALIRGHEALHAGAVASERGAVAIVAGSGGGKSTLLAELLGGGASLLADDVVVLEARDGGAPLAHPGPPLMTVPAPVRPLPGKPIAGLGEERWLAVPAAPEPLPLGAVVLLNRHPGAETGLRPLGDPLAVLLASLLGFPRAPERERARFELAAEIAAAVPIWELAADPSVTPTALADCLLAGL
jgi:hypothetical protein